MQYVKLTKGEFAIVDNEDFDNINQYKWYFCKGYAVRDIGGRKNRKTIYMHRLINGTPEKMETDHINRNKLDNRKCNLRSVDKMLNSINRGKNKNNKSGFKNIYFEKCSGKWRLELTVKNKNYRLGRFLNIKDAVNAQQRYEKMYGFINFDPSEE
jgi:hypothetical protein